jgi:hypothetical protein
MVAQEQHIMTHDSVKAMVGFLKTAFNASPTQLAGHLRISERTLTEWQQKGGIGDLKGKQLRLRRLADVVGYLQERLKEPDARNVIVNGRVRIGPSPDEDSEDDGTMSLMAWIVEFPEEKAWPGVVDEAAKDYAQFVASRRQHAHASSRLHAQKR